MPRAHEEQRGNRQKTIPKKKDRVGWAHIVVRVPGDAVVGALRGPVLQERGPRHREALLVDDACADSAARLSFAQSAMGARVPAMLCLKIMMLSHADLLINHACSKPVCFSCAVPVSSRQSKVGASHQLLLTVCKHLQDCNVSHKAYWHWARTALAAAVADLRAVAVGAGRGAGRHCGQAPCEVVVGACPVALVVLAAPK